MPGGVGRALAVARRDLAEGFRRPAFVIFAVLMVWNAFLASRAAWLISSVDTSVGGDKAWVTSEFQIAFIYALIPFFLQAFFIMPIVGLPPIRDAERRVGAILHATPLTPRQYVWGKFTAGLTVALAGVVALVLGMVLFAHFVPDLSDPEIYGPFSLGSYLAPALVFLVPSAVVIASMSFALGLLAGRPMLLFVPPVLLFVFLQKVTWSWFPAEMGETALHWLQWLDPSGFRWLKQEWFLVDRGLGFYNTQPLGYTNGFLWSRVGWVVAGLALVEGATRRFALTLRRSDGRRRRPRAARAESPRAGARVASAVPDVRSLAMRSSGGSWWSTARAVVRLELRDLVRQPALWIFLAFVGWLMVIDLSNYRGAFSTRMLFTSGLSAANELPTLGILVTLLLLFFTVEILGREEKTGAAPLVLASAAPTSALLVGKLAAGLALALAAMIAAFVGLALPIVGQKMSIPLELGPFVRLWGGVLTVTVLVWISFLALVWAWTRSRLATMAVGLVALFATAWSSFLGHTTWPFNWAIVDALTWSDMGGVGPDPGMLVLNRIEWLAVAGLLVWAAIRLYPRRVVDRLAAAGSSRPRGWRSWLLPVALATVVVVTAVPQVTAVAAGPEGGSTERRAGRYRQRNLLTWLDAPVAHIDRIDLDLELFPESSTFAVDGEYRLVNPHAEPLSRFAVSGGMYWSEPVWTVDGVERELEPRAGLWVVEPERPLLPGEALALGFRYTGRLPGGATRNGAGGAGILPGRGIEEFILPEGVVVTGRNPELVPVMGFLPGRGIDPDQAPEPRDWPADHHLGVTPAAGLDRSPFTARLRITAPEELTVNATGVKVAETEVEGRRTVVWETDAPVRAFNVVAGRWAEAKGDGVAVYHHPGHPWNVPVLVEALEASRRLYGEWFHPYPWRELRLNEFPGWSFYARGNPTNILFSEALGFFSDPGDPLGSFVITAHEAAHQWWGHLVSMGEGPGGIVLAEGGAHFSAMLLLQATRGEAIRQRFAGDIERRYGERRQPGTERPLTRTIAWRPADDTVIYDRGAWALWMTMRLMGREAFLSGIQEFMATWSQGPDHAQIPDLLEILRRHAPEPRVLDELTGQWFGETVVPEYRFEEAVKQSAGEGRWRVDLVVVNVGTGRQPVAVAVVGDKTSGDPPREARGTLVLGAGESGRLTLETAFEPEVAVVDPDVDVLQLERRAARVRLSG